ncbi:MAG: hypothetical protein EPN43_13915, partial [Jatrophihabitans sp.]
MASTQQSTGTEPTPAPSEFGANEWLVEEMYERYRSDPGSVDAAWHDFFADYRTDGTPKDHGPGHDEPAEEPVPDPHPAAAPLATAAAPPPEPAVVPPSPPATGAPAARPFPAAGASAG